MRCPKNERLQSAYKAAVANWEEVANYHYGVEMVGKDSQSALHELEKANVVGGAVSIMGRAFRRLNGHERTCLFCANIKPLRRQA
jgi:hypothetical protein